MFWFYQTILRPIFVLMEPKHVTKTMYYWPYTDVVLWLNKTLFEYSITQREGSYNKKNADDDRGHHLNMSVPYKGWLCDNFGNIKCVVHIAGMLHAH